MGKAVAWRGPTPGEFYCQLRTSQGLTYIYILPASPGVSHRFRELDSFSWF
jgi:hypothetical protein